jgi:hypothetical protein
MSKQRISSQTTPGSDARALLDPSARVTEFLDFASAASRMSLLNRERQFKSLCRADS